MPFPCSGVYPHDFEESEAIASKICGGHCEPSTCRHRQLSEKYTSRPSPPFHATAFCHELKLGNDCRMYFSQPANAKPGHKEFCQWKLFKGPNKPGLLSRVMTQLKKKFGGGTSHTTTPSAARGIKKPGYPRHRFSSRGRGGRRGGRRHVS